MRVRLRIHTALLICGILVAPSIDGAAAAEKKPLVDEYGFAFAARTWVDPSGKSDFKASLHLIDDGNFVVLKKSDDALVRLHYTQLSRGDQNYVLVKAKGLIRADAPPPPKPAPTEPATPPKPRDPPPPRVWSFQDNRPRLTASFVGADDRGVELLAADGTQTRVRPDELKSADVLYVIRAMSGGASRTLSVPGLTNARLWTDNNRNVVFASLVHLDLDGVVLRTPEGKEIALAVDDLGPYDRRLLKDNDREYARLSEVCRLLKASLEPPAPRTSLPSRSGSPSLQGGGSAAPAGSGSGGAALPRVRQPRLALGKFLLVGIEQFLIRGTAEAAADPGLDGFERIAHAMASELLKRHRDEVIEQIVREGFPDLGPVETVGMRIVIAAMLDGRLTLQDVGNDAVKELLKAELARENPQLAQQADLVEFLYDLSQTLHGGNR